MTHTDAPKWWQVVPVGAVLSALDPMEGRAEFAFSGERVTVDLFTDEVVSAT